MHALVTGASGFIGPHLVEQLVRHGIKVTCLVRSSSNLSRLKPLDPEFLTGDVLDPDSYADALSGFDVVFHLAGLTKSVPASVMWNVNEMGVRSMAQACARQSDPPVLVVLSSVAAAGPAHPERPIEETDPARPVSKYGVSKRKGEEAAFEFAEQVPISIVRSPIVFGEGDLDGLALFKSIASISLHMLPTIRHHHYSFIHASDLATAMMLVAEKGDRIEAGHHDKGIYFAAAETNPTFAEYGRMLADAMNVRHVLSWPNLSITIRIVGACSELFARVSRRPQIMNWDKTREALAGSWACSPKRLNQELGFQPARSMEERLSQTVQWYVENGHLKLKSFQKQT